MNFVDYIKYTQEILKAPRGKQVFGKIKDFFISALPSFPFNFFFNLFFNLGLGKQKRGQKVPPAVSRRVVLQLLGKDLWVLGKDNSKGLSCSLNHKVDKPAAERPAGLLWAPGCLRAPSACVLLSRGPSSLLWFSPHFFKESHFPKKLPLVTPSC